MARFRANHGAAAEGLLAPIETSGGSRSPLAT
jgi:hypothetical protein